MLRLYRPNDDNMENQNPNQKLKIGILNSFLRFNKEGSVEKVTWSRSEDLKVTSKVEPFFANILTIAELKKAPYQEMFIHNQTNI